MAWQFATLEMRSQENGPSEVLLRLLGPLGALPEGQGKNWSIVAQFQGLIIARGRYVSGQVVRASSPPRIRRRIALTEKAWEDAIQGGKVCSVALVSSVAVWSSHLSTSRMRFYFFQSKCVVIVSSPCDFPTREGCSMSFVRFVFLILWKNCVWNSFGAFSQMGFWRILQKFEGCSKLSSVNAYVHMLES